MTDSSVFSSVQSVSLSRIRPAGRFGQIKKKHGDPASLEKIKNKIKGVSLAVRRCLLNGNENVAVGKNEQNSWAFSLFGKASFSLVGSSDVIHTSYLFVSYLLRR